MQRATANRLGVAAACAGTAALICLPPAAVSTPSVLAAPGASSTPTASGTSTSSRPTATTTPSSNRDRIPPSPVTDLKMAGNDNSTFTVTWRPSSDNIAVKQYLVLLNGAYSTRTTSLGANFAWFDNQNKILVQVAAIDAAGNRSQWRTLYIVPPARDPVTSSSGRTRYLPPPPLDYQTPPAPRPTHRTTTSRPTRTAAPDPTVTASPRPTPTPTTSPTPTATRSVTPVPTRATSSSSPTQNPTKAPTSTRPSPTATSSSEPAGLVPSSTPPS